MAALSGSYGFRVCVCDPIRRNVTLVRRSISCLVLLPWLPVNDVRCFRGVLLAVSQAHPLTHLIFFLIDPSLHGPATGSPSARGRSEDGSLCPPMLILRVREIGGANVASTSRRESPRFFSNSGT
jgi:hypothetical protein